MVVLLRGCGFVRFRNARLRTALSYLAGGASSRLFSMFFRRFFHLAQFGPRRDEKQRRRAAMQIDMRPIGSVRPALGAVYRYDGSHILWNITASDGTKSSGFAK